MDNFPFFPKDVLLKKQLTRSFYEEFSRRGQSNWRGASVKELYAQLIF